MGKRLGQIIGEGLQEFADDLEAGRPITAKYNCRRMVVDLHPQEYAAADVLRTRRLLDASQAVFALVLGVSVKTLQKWEQGEQPPSPMACRFMDEIQADPEHFRKRLENHIHVQEADDSDEAKHVRC